jgi:predicted nucleotidyltransferase component of viral defense system
MIPRRFIEEWKENVPWPNDSQVEQDLIISRALIHIFSDSYLRKDLAFRGGTALHKMILTKPVRYSEDIDLVRRRTGPVKETVAKLQEQLSFLGSSNVERSQNNVTLKFRFDSEIPPVVKLRLKVEINCREHRIAFQYVEQDHSVESSWFRGAASIITYCTEELMGTKVRAMYQRKKGRDLFDLWYTLKNTECELNRVIQAFKHYTELSGVRISKKQYIKNIESKLQDPDFRGDIEGLLRPGIGFDFDQAWAELLPALIELME